MKEIPLTKRILLEELRHANASVKKLEEALKAYDIEYYNQPFRHYIGFCVTNSPRCYEPYRKEHGSFMELVQNPDVKFIAYQPAVLHLFDTLYPVLYTSEGFAYSHFEEFEKEPTT